MMGKKGDIYLGPTGSIALITAYGRTLSEADTEIGKSERTASGKLRKDIVATKKQFKLSYEIIKGDDLETFIALYELDSELILQIQHTDDPPTTTVEAGDHYNEYTVLMEPIPERTRLLVVGTGVWENAVITLNEV